MDRIYSRGAIKRNKSQVSCIKNSRTTARPSNNVLEPTVGLQRR